MKPYLCIKIRHTDTGREGYHSVHSTHASALLELHIRQKHAPFNMTYHLTEETPTEIHQTGSVKFKDSVGFMSVIHRTVDELAIVRHILTGEPL